MLRLSRCTLFTLLFVGGCGAGTDSGGTGGTTQPTGGSTGGAKPVACTPGDTSNLVSASAFVCDANTPVQIEGSFYAYGDGFSPPFSCTKLTPFCLANAGCCMTGTTVVDPLYQKWGCGLGMELNDIGGKKSVYSGPVKCFDIDLIGSSGGNEVRINFTQSTNTANTVSPFVSVAAFTNGWSGRVCFTDAQCPTWAATKGCTKAVGDPGTPYDLQIQVSAGSTPTSVGAFNVCVSKISPVIDPGSTGTTDSCTTVAGQGTITDAAGGTAHVQCNGQDYIVQSNQWGSTAGQTLTYGPGTKFKVIVQNGTGVNYNPSSFPSIFLGANNGHPTAGNELTRVVSSLNTVQTAWTWASNNATGSYNATYDVWFSNTGQAEPNRTSPSGAYLMVWFYKPTDNQPNGTSTASVTIGGKNWNLWVGTSNGVPCYSYVAQQSLNSLSFDLNLFIKDAVSRGYIQNSWGLTNVFAGFEIWSGGVGLETTDFAVTVN
jgi:hypothetical protein